MTWSGLITANDSLTITNGGTGAWNVSNTGNTLAAGKTLTVNDTNTAALNLVAWSTGAGSAIVLNSTNTGSLALNGIISGSASVTTTGGSSTGAITFTQQNTYTGGTLVAGGILQVSGAGATLGTGNVTVDNASSPASICRAPTSTPTSEPRPVGPMPSSGSPS